MISTAGTTASVLFPELPRRCRGAILAGNVEGSDFCRIVHQAALSGLTLLCLLPLWLAAESPPQGLPPLHVTPGNPDTFPRYYSVAQAPDGLLFVAGEEGVHAFDGRRWTTTELPNQRFVRSLAHDGERRLYVGGYGQFGHIELDPTGRAVYTDLTPGLNELVDADNFADVWHVEITPDGVFFRALFHLFRYLPDSGEIQTWHHPGRFGGIVWYEDAVWLQFRGSGLRRFNGEDFEAVPGGELLIEHVVAFLPLPDGGLLTMGRDGLWQRFNSGELSPWPAPETLPSANNFDAYLILPDGSFALGSPDGKLHLLDPRTRDHQVFQVDYDFISELAPALDGGLLIQTDRATTHLFWPSSWTRVGQETGLIGRINDLVLWQNSWLAITNAGVQRLDRGRFEKTGWSVFETWDWLELDPDRGLLADSFNLLEVTSDDSVRVIVEDLYPRLLLRSRFEPAHVLVGTEGGLAIVAWTGKDWAVRYQQSGFTGRVTGIIELSRRDLLLTIDGIGLVRVRMSEDLSRRESWRVHGPGDGIDYGSVIKANLTRDQQGNHLVATRTGIWRWTEERVQPLELAGIGPISDDYPLVDFAQSPSGELWVYRERELWRQVEADRWVKEDLSALEPGVISSINFTDTGRVLVGDQAAILTYDPTIETVESRLIPVQLREVELIDGQGRLTLLPLDARPLVLPHDIASIRFSYALPSYRQPQLNQYRARLVGYEADFSNWGRIQRITYSQIGTGLKRFEVEARDHLGRVSRIEPFQFEVLAPWYGTLWARLIWAALTLGLLCLIGWWLIRSRVARLEAERQRLADMVEQRTADLAAANRKLENMANVDGLTGVANRRRLDEYLQEAWTRAIHRQSEFALALIDVDHFKQFNDNQGHQAGDEALRSVASLLTGALRRNEDVVARYGGEEFMVVLPSAGLERARKIAEVLRAAVESSPLGVTASVGVAATRASPGQSLEALIEAADQALYRAKQNGRNRVEVAEDIP